ncbi:MAG: hypothetical protein U1F36_03125 [Planctomycetota bacterium]
MNIPDGQWDNGEGFGFGNSPTNLVPDVGGYLSGAPHGTPVDDHVVGLTVGDVHSFGETASPQVYWHNFNYGSGTVQRFLGYLRPVSLGPYPLGSPVQDAAFEVFAPVNLQNNLPTVIVIGTWSTFGTPRDPSVPGLGQNRTPDRLKYPGHRRTDGLIDTGQAAPNDIYRAGFDIVNLAANSASSGLQVISAYIVPRTSGRPMVFEMQRYLELAGAIDLMLSGAAPARLRPVGMNPVATSLPKYISGGSMGGFTALEAALRFPNTFQGAGFAAFSGSVRRTMGEQFTWDAIGRRTGMGY